MTAAVNHPAADATALIDRYIAVWNETDTARRRALIAQTWTPDARYLDPLMAGAGREGIDAMVQAVQEAYPGNRFRRTSEVDLHHDRVRFGWTLGPDGGPALAQGIDFAVIAPEQLLASVTGFLDQPAAAQR